MATDPNTTELNAHPGAASEPSLVAPDGKEYSLFEREVSADGMVRLNAGTSAGINLGMGYVDDGKDTPVSLAADTVSTSRELYTMEGEGGLGTPDGTPGADSLGAREDADNGEAKTRKAAKRTEAAGDSGTGDGA